MQELRDRLQKYVFDDPDVPVVRIMVGDNNLVSLHVNEALQRETDADPLWEVHPSPAGKQGDHVAVTGAARVHFQPIAVGASYKDRGMRNDSHDVCAVVIILPDASQRPGAKRRRRETPEVTDEPLSREAKELHDELKTFCLLYTSDAADE